MSTRAGRYTPRNSHEFWNHLTTNNLEKSLLSIPGIHVDNMFENLLHDMLQGTSLEIAGSAILWMARHGVWGPLGLTGSWQERLDVALLNAWKDLKR